MRNFAGMSAFDSPPRPVWWRILRQPQHTFSVMIEGGRGRFNLLVLLLAGIALFQIWADLFNLADHYPVGKIMGMSLILGPIAGLIFSILLATFGMYLGNLSDPNHKPSYTYQESNPPFPLRNLLWKKIFGKKRLNAAFHSPGLAWYKKTWSTLKSRRKWVLSNLSGGKASLDILFSGISAALTVLILANLFMWLELVFFDGAQFFSVPPTENPFSLLFLILKIGFLGWLLYLWWALLKQGFKLAFIPTLLITFISFVLALSFTIIILSFIFQLPVF